MCGIFGLVSDGGSVDKTDLNSLVLAARQRGRDSSGFAFKKLDVIMFWLKERIMISINYFLI